MSEVSKERILKGPIARTLFTLGWPVMLTQFLHMAYSLADTFWLGHLGGDEGMRAVATIQISWPAIMVLLSLGVGLGMAGVALISQYKGADMTREANKSAGQVISSMLIFSSIVAVIGYFSSPFIIGLLEVDEEIAQGAILYIRIIFLGLPLEFIAFGTESIFRAYGDTITPMKVIGVAVIFNMVLDPLMIFGVSIFPKMGIMGAAVATLISYGLAGFVGLYLLFSGRYGIRIRARYLIPIKKEVVRIIEIGLPASIAQAGLWIGFFLLMYVIAMLPDSTLILASYGIGDRIISIVFVVIWGLGAACATMVGQTLGADRIQRAREVIRSTILISFSLLSLISLTIYIFRYRAIAVFIDDPEVVKEGALFLSILVVGIPFFGIFHSVNSTFQGSGHNVPVMVAEIARLLVLRLPLCYLLGVHLGWGPTGIWVGMAVSNLAAAFIGLALLATGIWKTRIIDEKHLAGERDPDPGENGPEI